MDLFGIVTGPIKRMSHVHRYSSFPVHRRENVAEHSWWVAMIALLITKELKLMGHHLDTGVVLERALVHDLDEAVSGDIIRSFKYSTDAMHAAIEEAAELNVREMTSKMHPVGDSLRLAWQNAKTDTLAGAVVKFADMASVVFYCVEEYHLGNVEVEHVLKELYETWFFEWHEHPQLGRYADQLFPGKRYHDPFVRVHPAPKGATVRTDGIDGGPIMSSAMMRDHAEGVTSEYDSAAWPARGDVPLG